MAKLQHKCGPDFALNNGTNIPAIGFGTWKVPNDKAKEAISNALECGYRHFDCALEYGNQEEIGEVLQEFMESKKVQRGELFITSKLWNTHHKRHVAYDDLDTSLRQLKLHHIDLWLMHWPLSFVSAPTQDHRHQSAHGEDTTKAAKDTNGKVLLDETSIMETWKAMEGMYKDGKARAIGVCNFTLPLLRRLLEHCEIAPAVVQIELHPYLQQQELIEFCQSQGIHVTAYSPLGSQTDDDVNVLEDPVLKEIAKTHNRTPGQVVLQWNIQRHVSVIPKSLSPEHMRENLQIFDFDLTKEEITKIENLDRNYRFLSPKKMWGISLFPDETGDVEIAQAVGEMYSSMESAR